MNESFVKAVNACVRAGEAIMKVYNTDFKIDSKPDHSPITLADRNSNDIIQTFLEKTGIPIISEENEEVDYHTRNGWNKLWLVDPLDGTREFIKRNGEFTVNIALIENGRTVWGCIYIPATGYLYVGDAQQKETRRLIIKDHEKVSVKDIEGALLLKPSLNSSLKLRVLTSRSYLNDKTSRFIETIKSKNQVIEITKVGSSLKFCLMAEGKADIYPRFAPSMEWDTAAGQAICEAVGIPVNDVLSDAPIQYNREHHTNGYFICGRGYKYTF